MSQLPHGYRTVDRAQVKGRLKNLSPLDKSMRSLLVKDTTIRNEKDAEEKTKPPIGKVKSLSDIISNNIQAATDLRTITHYIKRAEQIWTTLLLKPNGDQKQLLIYDSENSDIKNGKLHELLLQQVENYFTTKYPIEETIPQIIKDVLFRTGSYVYFNMSHPALDHLINGMEVDADSVAGKESLTATANQVLTQHFVGGNFNTALNVGYIRKERSTAAGSFVGFESLYGSRANREPEYNLVDPALKWTFTDNPVVLKTSELANRLREDRLRNMSGMEGIEKSIRNVFQRQKGKKKKTNNNNVGIVSNKTFQEEIKSLYPDRNYDDNESISIRKSKFYSGRNRGLGITYHWPSESCIPVNLNGEIGKPFGFILMTDPETGDPLKNTSDVKFYQRAKGAGEVENKPKMGSMNEIVNHIRNVAQGKECTEDMEWMVQFASATLEKELIEGFINGDLHKDVTVSLTEENKKLFLGRAMRDQGVRAIFVPAEYVTYIAVDYNKLGVGRSLVDEAKLHITRLAVLDTADALAQVENAISHTLMTIDLEKEDLDPRNVAAMIRDEYFANNPTLHDILGYNNVSIDSVLDRFKEQSLTIKVNPGDNPHIIAPQIESRQMEREPLKSIDRDTRENLLNAVAGYFVLKRSWLEDTGEGNDFAVEALAEQELLRNQSTEFSRVFARGLTDFMRKHIRVNEPLINDLVDIIKDNKKLYMKPDQTGTLELDEELKAKLEEDSNEDGELTDAEMSVIEAVLKDFMNTMFVVLPTPAITEALNKIEDKIEAVDKLVEFWVDIGGGTKMMKRQAEKAGLEADDVVETVRAVLLNEAFERFNLPMPFESILRDGNAGGILNIVSHVTDLDMNVHKFLTEWLKGNKKTKKLFDKLKEQVEKMNEEETPEEEIQEQTDLNLEQEQQQQTDDILNENPNDIDGEQKQQDDLQKTEEEVVQDEFKDEGQLEENKGVGGDNIAGTNDDIFPA